MQTTPNSPIGDHEAERAPKGNQLDSAVLAAYLCTESKRNLPPLDAFSGLFYAQNAFAGTPLAELTMLTNPLADGKGLTAPPKNPTPFGPSVSTLFLFYETTTGPHPMFQGGGAH